MKKIRLTKEVKPNGKNVYRALDDDGTILYQSSPTHREYVAMFLNWYIDQSDGSKKWDCAYRFGRMDLVGKGESKYMFGNPDCYFAVL